MRRPRKYRWALVAAAWLASTTSSMSIPGSLLGRDTCSAGADYSQCAGTGLPSDFCCKSDTTCVPLAGNSTILCCPSGQSCNVIKPITCDIQQQNATAHPDSTLKTTALTGTLSFCGVSCCPFGYACNGDGNCVQDKDQSILPATSSSVTSSTTSTSATSTSATSTSATSTPTLALKGPTSDNSTSASSASDQKSSFPTGPVLGGIFGGLALGIGVTIFLIWCCGKRKRASAAARRGSSPSFGMATISEPMPIDGIRTDFLRKVPMSPSTMSMGPQRGNTIRRVRSLFRKSGSQPNASQMGMGSEMPPPRVMPMMIQSSSPQELPVPASIPLTPPKPREPSYIDIDIFTDNDTASALRERHMRGFSDSGSSSELGMRNTGLRDSAHTTFSDMLEESGLAGLQKGQPYIYKGGVSPPYPPTPRDR